MIKAAFFCNQSHNLDWVYPPSRRERLAGGCRLHPVVVTKDNFAEQLPALQELEVIFSTWGMPALSPEQIIQLPRLKAVFYAAGSVKQFAAPFLQRGIQVVSAWAANAVPVAEFTCSQILLANKGYFRNIRDCASPQTRSGAFRGPGNFGETIGLLGAGMVGRKVVELLRPFRLRVVVFDPYLSAESADSLGVEKMELAEVFSRAFVVSNHLANVPATCGMLRREHFAAMRSNAVFINTGRGATLVEADLIQVLHERPDLTALLDVTNPEPPAADSPFYELSNAILSSHIAGSIGDEVVRMADLMIEEFEAWRTNRPVRYGVTLEQLGTMA